MMEDHAELFCLLCENAVKLYGLSILPANTQIDEKIKKNLCKQIITCIDLLGKMERDCKGLEKLANSFLDYLNHKCNKSTETKDNA